MSAENVELVRRGYEAFERGDFAVMLDLLDPEVVSYRAAPLPDPAEHHGHQGFLRWIGDWTGSFDRFEMEVEDYTDAGDRVVVRVLQRGTGVESGVPVSQTFWVVHTIRGGRVVRVGIHGTEEQAREVAGLDLGG